MKAAQVAANKLQWIIESALACLLETRLKYPLSMAGIIEAFLPQRKIEFICVVSTIGSMLISGITYLTVHGLPSFSPERLLGQCKTLNLIQFETCRIIKLTGYRKKVFLGDGNRTI